MRRRTSPPSSLQGTKGRREVRIASLVDTCESYSPHALVDAGDRRIDVRTCHSQDSTQCIRRAERQAATRRCRGASSTALGPPSQTTLPFATHDTYWARPPAPCIYIAGASAAAAAGSAVRLTFDSRSASAEAALRRRRPPRRRCRWDKPLVVRNLRRNRRGCCTMCSEEA